MTSQAFQEVQKTVEQRQSEAASFLEGLGEIPLPIHNTEIERTNNLYVLLPKLKEFDDDGVLWSQIPGREVTEEYREIWTNCVNNDPDLFRFIVKLNETRNRLTEGIMGASLMRVVGIQFEKEDFEALERLISDGALAKVINIHAKSLTYLLKVLEEECKRQDKNSQYFMR